MDWTSRELECTLSSSQAPYSRMQFDAALPSGSPAVAIPLLGVLIQFGGAALIVALFTVLRRFVLRRAYFTVWVWAWVAFSVATAALVARFVFLPAAELGSNDTSVASRVLGLIYETSKTLGFLLFVRGTVMYVAGGRTALLGRSKMLVTAVAFSAIAALLSTEFNELWIWQSVVAVPALGYCATAMFRLPRSRRTVGSNAAGFGFALLGVWWLVSAGAFGLLVRGGTAATPLLGAAAAFAGFNAYVAMLLNAVLGYAMVVVLMQDAKREVDDAHAELRVSHDHLRRAAMFDPLTESLNRRAFGEGVGLEMARATYGTAVLADLDNLKEMNDIFGHTIGDALLRQCADALRTALRPYDKLYRWGGDEFLVILPSARASDVLPRLEAVLRSAGGVPVDELGGLAPLAVSLGAADYASAEELDEAIALADRAMYREKWRRKGPARSPSRGIQSLIDGGGPPHQPYETAI
jgi:diguanylate cyclase (GGDEF)-like protein